MTPDAEYRAKLADHGRELAKEVAASNF